MCALLERSYKYCDNNLSTVYQLFDEPTVKKTRQDLKHSDGMKSSSSSSSSSSILSSKSWQSPSKHKGHQYYIQAHTKAINITEASQNRAYLININNLTKETIGKQKKEIFSKI